jgi:NifU-like protein involved in Fe-S cluster formation
MVAEMAARVLLLPYQEALQLTLAGAVVALKALFLEQVQVVQVVAVGVGITQPEERLALTTLAAEAVVLAVVQRKQAMQVVLVLSFCATPAQFNISLVAQ